jgi:hypothetical protein
MDEKGLVMKNCATFFSSLVGCIMMCASLSSLADIIPSMTSEQGVRYITGGISEDEAEAIRGQIKQYNLRVIFSEGKSGRLITDVNVSIYDANNTLVFDVIGAQPQLLLNLPTGTYKIVANYHGVKQSHQFSMVKDKHKKVILNWKNNTEEDQLDESDINSTD